MLTAFWQRLLRRWFIEYNPFYLLSATCVLVGVNQVSEALAHSRFSLLAVAAVDELYAWALILGSALLTRIQLRRPAVILVLLAAVYQCDPTLHTETCAYLGYAGDVAAVLWLASFVGKLYALAWAMRVRASRSALLVPSFGALGLVVIPRFLAQFDATTMTSFVAFFVFGLFAVSLSTLRRIASTLELDAWGRTVLDRTTFAIWSIWSVLILAHVWFWVNEFNLNFAVLFPVALLLQTLRARREREVWVSVGVALLVARFMPTYFSTLACLASLSLLLRAFRGPLPEAGVSVARLLVGSLYCAYLFLWTRGFTRGALPSHVLALDLLLSAALLGLFWKSRRKTTSLPLLATYLHYGVATGIVLAPRTKLQWGVVYVALGFSLLLTSLTVSVYVQRFGSSRDTPDSE